MRATLARLAAALRSDYVVAASTIGTIAAVASLPFLIPIVTGGRYDFGVLFAFKLRMYLDNAAWSASLPAFLFAMILGLIVGIVAALVLRLVGLAIEFGLAARR